MKVITADAETIDLGDTETTPTISIIDYSRRETDDFGVTTVVRRGFARRLSVRMALAFDAVDALQQRLAALRATSALWVADDRFEWLSAQGFYKDFEIDLSVPPTSFCTLTIEGVAETETVEDAGEDPAPIGQASTLQLLEPVVIGDEMLAASSVPESIYSAWDADTTYALGARVSKASTHRVYESAAAANAGNDPTGASGLWLDVGPTNRWAMFDQALGTATSSATPIIVTLDAGRIDAIALLDVLGTTVQVQTTGYDQTHAVSGGAVTFFDMPGADDPVTVTVAGVGTLAVGTLLAGPLVGLGLTAASPTAGINDYSRKEVDDFGEVTIVERAWAKRMTARSLIDTGAVDIVANRVASVRAKPCLWVGDGAVDGLIIYGFYKDFSIEVGEAVSTVSLSIEGLSKAAAIPDPPPDPSLKSRVWSGQEPPSFANSDPYDVWLDPGDKGRRYLRTGGRFSIGGNAIKFGGQYLLIAPGWRTDDGSVRTYSQTDAPAHPKPGTRWQIPGTGQEFEWNPILSNWMPIADITSLNTVTVSMPGLVLAADYLGVVTEDLLPAVLTPQVTLGGADVRTANGTHYAIANMIGGLTAAGVVTVNDTNGSDDKGRVTISSDYAGPGSFDLVVTVAGDEQPPLTVSVSQNNAQPPTGGSGTGGGGGGAGVAIRATADLTGQRAAASYAVIASFPAIVVASGETPVTSLAVIYTYKAVADGEGGLDVKWQFAVAGSGSWTDFSSGGGVGPTSYWDGGAHIPSPASFSFSDSETLGAGTYDFRLLAARDADSGSITVATGNASVGISS